MNIRNDSRKPGLAKQTLAYVLAIAMVLSCNGWVGPVTTAWAQQQNSTEAEQAASSSSGGGSASSAASTSGASEASPSAGVSASTNESATASSATASSSASSSTDSAASSETTGGTKPAEQTPAHKELSGSLLVFLDSTLGGTASDAPATVAVQLQKRSQSWNANVQEWSSIDAAENHGWTDVDAASGRVVLSSQQVKDAVAASYADSNPDNDGAAYAFDGLEVQSVTAEGAYQTRTEYRAIVTGVDAKDANTPNVAYASEDAAAKTASYTVDASDTAAGSASYTLTVSTEAGLSTEGSDAGAEHAAAHARPIALAGTSVSAPDENTGDASTEDTQTSASEGGQDDGESAADT